LQWGAVLGISSALSLTLPNALCDPEMRRVATFWDSQIIELHVRGIACCWGVGVGPQSRKASGTQVSGIKTSSSFAIFARNPKTNARLVVGFLKSSQCDFCKTNPVTT
jgi:hypothetical protein